MEDYPRSAEEFERRFATEGNCRDYLVSLRWPDGFCCPACKGAKAVLVRAKLFQCSNCRRKTSATAGTMFQDTRKPLKTWFANGATGTTERWKATDCIWLSWRLCKSKKNGDSFGEAVSK